MYLPFSNRRLPAGLFASVVSGLLLSACFSTPANRTGVIEASATVAGGRPLVVHRSEADDRVVAYLWQSQGQFVRIEASESGAQPHRQPATLSGGQIKQALTRVHLGGKDSESVLTEEAIDKIATPLATALSRAEPDQEITFAVTYRPTGFGLLMPRRVTTGRLFRERGGLHLIIGLMQTPYEEEMMATGQRIAFTPGSRQHRIHEGWSLAADNLVTHPVAGRDDWIRIDPNALSASADRQTERTSTPQRAAQQPTVAQPGSQTELKLAPQHSAQPPQPPATQPDRYKRVEERLEALKRLRDKGLISEQAYEQKSQQILEEL